MTDEETKQQQRTETSVNFPEPGEFSVANLKAGVFMETVDAAVQDCIRDILNTEKNATAKRTVTVKIHLLANESRDQTRYVTEVTTKLAPDKPVAGSLGIGQDLHGNLTVADHDIRQGRLFPNKR